MSRDIEFDEALGEWKKRQLLRHPRINYENGWFFVTIQVAGNKSIFGAIVGETCVLNALGEAIAEAWRHEAELTAGLTLDEFQVMPNHIHLIFAYVNPELAEEDPRIESPGWLPVPKTGRAYARSSKAHDVPWFIGRFKSWTTRVYRQLCAAGQCVDIGEALWQSSFYDEVITSKEQLAQTRAYVQGNPRNWNSDRFGPVTTYQLGNAALLESRYVAFVSSEGGPLPGMPGGPPPTAVGAMRDTCGSHADRVTPTTVGGGPLGPIAERAPVISTFTSYEERQVLAQCLRHGRRFIWVCPGGIPEELVAPTTVGGGPLEQAWRYRGIDLAAVEGAVRSGQALIISPVPSGTGVNKQRANWCNSFLLKNAAAIHKGWVRSGGGLEAILKGLFRAVSATYP